MEPPAIPPRTGPSVSTASTLPSAYGLDQKGLASRGYDAGRYGPRHESGLHQFHRPLRAALGEDA